MIVDTIHFVLRKRGRQKHITDKVEAAALEVDGWRIVQRYVMCSLNVAKSGVQIPLLLDDDSIPDVLRPFLNIESLHALWVDVQQLLTARATLSPEKSAAMGFLMDLLTSEDGAQIMSALREYSRREKIKQDKRLLDHIEMASPADGSVDADTTSRRRRRINQRLKSLG